MFFGGVLVGKVKPKSSHMHIYGSISHDSEVFHLIDMELHNVLCSCVISCFENLCTNRKFLNRLQELIAEQSESPEFMNRINQHDFKSH